MLLHPACPPGDINDAGAVVVVVLIRILCRAHESFVDAIVADDNILLLLLFQYLLLRCVMMMR